MTIALPFTAEAQIVCDKNGRIKFWQRSNNSREHFHVGIWIDGNLDDLDRVDHVVYELHPSFNRRLRSSHNRNNKFGITIWTWGLFNINIKVMFKNGDKLVFDHFLNYQLPEDDGTNYIRIPKQN